MSTTVKVLAWIATFANLVIVVFRFVKVLLGTRSVSSTVFYAVAAVNALFGLYAMRAHRVRPLLVFVAILTILVAWTAVHDVVGAVTKLEASTRAVDDVCSVLHSAACDETAMAATTALLQMTIVFFAINMAIDLLVIVHVFVVRAQANSVAATSTGKHIV